MEDHTYEFKTHRQWQCKNSKPIIGGGPYLRASSMISSIALRNHIVCSIVGEYSDDDNYEVLMMMIVIGNCSKYKSVVLLCPIVSGSVRIQNPLSVVVQELKTHCFSSIYYLFLSQLLILIHSLTKNRSYL